MIPVCTEWSFYGNQPVFEDLKGSYIKMGPVQFTVVFDFKNIESHRSAIFILVGNVVDHTEFH